MLNLEDTLWYRVCQIYIEEGRQRKETSKKIAQLLAESRTKLEDVDSVLEGSKDFIIAGYVGDEVKLHD